MEITADVPTLRESIADWRKAGETIALVTTMGNLHQGHLSLVEIAKQNASKVVVSIFVNPLQFSPTDDLASYPQTLAEDCEKLKTLAVDSLFTPSNKTLYPNGQAITRVTVPDVTVNYCGESRPQFFGGIATILTKLFNIIQPNVVVYGKKDYQQAVMVQKLVQDFNLPIQVIMGDTCREDSGLALSSRNGYLSVGETTQAATLYQTLLTVKEALHAGAGDYAALLEKAMATLTANGFKVDYVDIANRNTMMPAQPDDKQLLILVAATMGTTRLIDNVEVDI